MLTLLYAGAVAVLFAAAALIVTVVCMMWKNYKNW
jgi:hypothetical protein